MTISLNQISHTVHRHSFSSLVIEEEKTESDVTSGGSAFFLRFAPFQYSPKVTTQNPGDLLCVHRVAWYRMGKVQEAGCSLAHAGCWLCESLGPLLARLEPCRPLHLQGAGGCSKNVGLGVAVGFRHLGIREVD